MLVWCRCHELRLSTGKASVGGPSCSVFIYTSKKNNVTSCDWHSQLGELLLGPRAACLFIYTSTMNNFIYTSMEKNVRSLSTGRASVQCPCSKLFVPVARLMSQVVTDPLNRATWKASDGCPGRKFICTSTKNAWTICHQLWLSFTTGQASVVASLPVQALRMLNKLWLTLSTREASVGSPCRKFTCVSIKKA